jgi:hypothetical protein
VDGSGADTASDQWAKIAELDREVDPVHDIRTAI